MAEINTVRMPDGSKLRVPPGIATTQIRAFVARKLQEDFDVSGLSSAKFEALVDGVMAESQGINPNLLKDKNAPAVDVGLTPDQQAARNRKADPSPSMGERVLGAMERFVNPSEVPVGALLNPVGAAVKTLQTGKSPTSDWTLAPRALLGAAPAGVIAGAATVPEKLGVMDHTDSRRLERDMHGMIAGMAGLPMQPAGVVGKSVQTHPNNRVSRTARAFKRTGVKPTPGQLLGSKNISRIDNTAGNAPFVKSSETRTQQANPAVAKRVTALADDLSPNIRTPEAAGSAIQGGLRKHVEKFRSNAEKLYKNVGIADDTDTPITNTLTTLDEINASVPNAPNVSGKLNLEGVRGLVDALKADAPNGSLSYAAVSAIRSKIGSKLASFDLTPDIPRAQLKRIYAALTNDLRGIAAQQGKLAEFDRAAQYYRQGIKRIDEVVEPILKNKIPEKVFGALERSGREGETQLKRVLEVLKPEQRQAVASMVLRRMGQATPGKQNLDGSAFSLDTYLTNWNRMASSAKNVVFGKNSKLRKNLDEIAFVVDRIKEHNNLGLNTSRTAQNVIGGTALGATGTSAASALMSGTPELLVAALGGLAAGPAIRGGMLALGKTTHAGAVAPDVARRLMGNTNFTGWMVRALKATNLSKSINSLERNVETIRDPQLQQDVYEFLDAVRNIEMR